MNGDRDAMISHYRLLERIGQGGMGIVCKALDTRLERVVALKILRPDRPITEEDRRRLLLEARTAASLNHPNICTVHEVGEVGAADRPTLGARPLDLPAGTPFLVMEWLDGETLRDRLERTGALPFHEVVDVALQVAGGLAAAHAKGIVHRDLKPENVALGAAGRWKILDFGLAVPRRPQEPASEEDSTASGVTPPVAGIAGTIAYMSPEQLLGRPIGPPSDLFSLGAMLQELASGRHPFRGDSVPETMARILRGEAEPSPRGTPSLPEMFAAVLDRCLETDAARRYVDAAELRDALEAAAAGEVVPSPGDGAPSPDTVAVLPFAVRGDGSHAYLGEGLVDLLGTKLDGAGELRSVDAHAVLCCLPRTPGEEIDPEEGAGVARRLGAGLFVLGTLVEAAGTLSLSAGLYDATGDTPVRASRASVRGPASTIFDLLDRLTASLLACRQTGPAARLGRIAASATEVFPALKAYLEGERFMREMDRERAVAAFRQAVEQDPRFALAWYRLSVASLWGNEPQQAWEASRRALANADRLTERDRMLLQAFDALLQGDNHGAERLYRAVVGAWPDDVEAWFQLGELAFHHGPLHGRTICESRPPWDRVLALDPGHLSAWVHLVAVGANQGNVELVEEASRQVLRIGPESDAARWVRALDASRGDDAAVRAQVLDELRDAPDRSLIWTIRFLAVFHGDSRGARPFVDLLLAPERSDEARVLGRLYRASEEMAAGRGRAARRELEEAARIDPVYAGEHRALFAAHPLGILPESDPIAFLDSLPEPGPEPSAPPVAPSLWLAPHAGLHLPLRLYLRALSAWRSGDPGALGRLAVELERMAPDERRRPFLAGLAGSLRAFLAWEQGRRDDALDLLEAGRMRICLYYTLWSTFLAQDLERFLRAEWLRESGHPEQALPWYATFGENNVFDRVHVAPSHLQRGRIHDRREDRRKAIFHYERFADLWNDCDPHLRPLVEEARSRASELRAC